MILPPEIEKYQQVFQLFSKRLQKKFSDMDKKYQEAASYYDFLCEGCRDNCCRSLFFHHTFLEYLYIHEGYHTLRPEKQAEVKNRAQAICREPQRTEKKDSAAGPMCPLNFNERCALYSYRPMICRLHGIPHELQRPGQGIITGPGCGAFTQKHAEKNYFKFDRTPFYFELAVLEKDFKNKAGITHKLKITIAEIISTHEIY